MVPYVAYLRVYEPLTAFADSEAAHWASYAHAAAAETDPVTTLRDEQQKSLTAVLQAPGLASPTSAEGSAYVLREGDDVFVCPHDIQLRSWLALAELIEEIGDQRLRLLSPGSLEHVNPEFMSWRSRHPDAVPHIRQCTWQVPPAWLLLVEPEDRQSYQAGGQESVRFRVPLVRARRRLARAYDVVQRALEDEPITDVLTGLDGWLECFHPDSRLEVDYAGVARLLGDGPAHDSSCADVGHAVEALGRGDVADAAAAYERVVERWRQVRMAEHAN